MRLSADFVTRRNRQRAGDCGGAVGGVGVVGSVVAGVGMGVGVSAG